MVSNHNPVHYSVLRKGLALQGCAIAYKYLVTATKYLGAIQPEGAHGADVMKIPLLQQSEGRWGETGQLNQLVLERGHDHFWDEGGIRP